MYTMYMALHITNPETDRNARALAAATGETIAEAVNTAVVNRLKLVTNPTEDPALVDDLKAIVLRMRSRTVLDPRAPDEILGYDDHGLPT